MKPFGFIQQLLGNEQQNTGTFDKNLHIQLQTFPYTRLLNKPYKNEFTFREQNLPLKCHKPLKILLYYEKRFRSLNAGNMESVGQRAAKFLSDKL